MTRVAPSPVRLPPNPVWRSYPGGAELRRFRGLSVGRDDHFPEDWLASSVRARNGSNSRHPDEGLSRIETGDKTWLLPDLLRQQPDNWWGRKCGPPNEPSSTGVLWKLLDSSGRLQFQAHPNRQFARQHLNSPAGKTECWYILATRHDAHVYLGFQHPPDRAAWKTMIEREDVRAMESCFEKIPVRPGDCYVVPAGAPHAIGAGIFMLELQEPTDWVVRCERTNAGLTLPPEACFMGLDLDTCLDVFDYSEISPAEVERRFKQSPQLINSQDNFREEEIIGPDYREFFRLHRLLGSGAANWIGGELTLLIALSGDGYLDVENCHRTPIRAGETWLLPGSAGHWQWSSNDSWEILLARPPIKSVPVS